MFSILARSKLRLSDETYNARDFTIGMFTEVFRCFVFALGEIDWDELKRHLLLQQNCRY